MDALEIIDKAIRDNEKKKIEIDADSKALSKVKRLIEKQIEEATKSQTPQ
jgi:hypothetical protein